MTAHTEACPHLHVLVIGGSRFVGYQLVWRLLAAGRRVTVLNRGSRPDPFHGRVEHLCADRTGAEFAAVLQGRTFDAAVDFAAYTGADARGVVEALGSSIGHYVFIGSGQVYLVREGARRPAQTAAREEDYAGPLQPAPSSPHDREEWRYGIGKRDAEDAVAAAFGDRGFPATRLRLPMINGERDYRRRMEAYLWRLLDGGPLLLPDGGAHRVRHVYSGSVVGAICRLLGDPTTHGQAYNLAQDETPTLAELVAELRKLTGSSSEIVAMPSPEIAAAGLDPVALSPFSEPWASFLEPSKAKRQIGFAHLPLREYLGRIVAAHVNHLPAAPPDGYRQRSVECRLAE